MSRTSLSRATQYFGLVRSFRSLQLGPILEETKIIDRVDLRHGHLFRYFSINRSPNQHYALFSTSTSVFSQQQSNKEPEAETRSSEAVEDSQSNRAEDEDAKISTSASDSAKQQPTPTTINKVYTEIDAEPKKDSINDRLLRMSGTLGPSEYDNMTSTRATQKTAFTSGPGAGQRQQRQRYQDDDEDEDEEEYGGGRNRNQRYKQNYNRGQGGFDRNASFTNKYGPVGNPRNNGGGRGDWN